MDKSRYAGAHPFAFVATMLLVVLSMGTGGSALADSGHGSGQASQVAATRTHAKKSAESSPGGGSSTKGGGGNSASTGSGGSTSSDHSEGNAGTQGSYDSPQPLSNADRNAGGSNGKCPGGPYCSTRDGSPSMNGNGNGQAVGKPCAGCVGKADNKNPKGQYPNGSDRNAGYECDTNHGIGRTNPAHTGCTTPPPSCTGGDCTPPSCTGGDCTPPSCTGGDCTPPSCTGEDCTPPSCTGEDCTPPTCDTCGEGSHEGHGEGSHEGHGEGSHEEHAVPGNEVTSGRPRAAVVLGAETAPAAAPAGAQAGGLPATGAPPALELAALAGLGLLVAGAATLLLRRRSAR